MKVAIVGVGGMGGNHFNIYKKMDNVELIAACDVRIDMLKEKAEGMDINLYADFDEMLKCEKPDIIDISTPTHLHCEYSLKALESGANVICEKPLSLSSEESKKVLETAKKCNKLFMVAHVVRFMNAYIYLKGVIDSNKYGKMLRLDMKRISGVPTWSHEDWMLDKNKSGHVVLDLMIHDIDFMQYVFGMPKDICGAHYEMNNMSNYAAATYFYDGFSVSAEAGWYKYDIPFDASYRAIFENGCVECRDGKLLDNSQEISLDKADEIEDTGINLSNVDGYDAEIAYFIECVKNNTQPSVVTPESSADSIKLVEMTWDKMKKI